MEFYYVRSYRKKKEGDQVVSVFRFLLFHSIRFQMLLPIIRQRITYKNVFSNSVHVVCHMVEE
jgi:hypothetical protein